MNFNFKNLSDFHLHLGTIEQCKKALELSRWNGEIHCVHCGADKVYRTNRGFKCSTKECAKKFTVTSGTIYDSSKLPLTKWFLAAYLLTSAKKGVSSYQIARQVGVSQKTAWYMLHRIREQVRAKIKEQMQGVIEVDETYIGGKAANKHKHVRTELIKNGTGGANKSGVLGILERNGEVRTFMLNKYDGATIQPIIRDNVAWGNSIVTDGHSAYKDLNKIYYHTIVNHGKDEFVIGKMHTNSIEGFWSLLKRGIHGIYHQVSPKHLHRYCDEFAYRYNSRKVKDNVRFAHTILNAECKPLRYKTLIS